MQGYSENTSWPAEDDDAPLQSSTKQERLHAHRLDHNPSKLPAFRLSDLTRRPLSLSPHQLLTSDTTAETTLSSAPKQGRSSSLCTSNNHNSTTESPTRTKSQVDRHSPTREESSATLVSRQVALASEPRPNITQRLRKAPASRSSKNTQTSKGPPVALSTRRCLLPLPNPSSITTTTEWAHAQRKFAINTHSLPTTVASQKIPMSPERFQTRHSRGAIRSLDETVSSAAMSTAGAASQASNRHTIAGVRAEKNYHHGSDSDDCGEEDRDSTLRALEGHYNAPHDAVALKSSRTSTTAQRELSTGDPFLDLARDDLSRGAQNEADNSSTTSHHRSRIAQASHRSSLPLSASNEMPSPQHSRRGSDMTSVRRDRPSSRLSSLSSYRAMSLDRPSPASAHPMTPLDTSVNISPRVLPPAPRSSIGYKEFTFESQLAYPGRRGSTSDRSPYTPARNLPYRQSNLSNSMPRTYNSSPLVSRSVEVEENTEVPRAEEGTNSTSSTNAPSTVWDELDNLKSRIHRLELTGKMPTTSGAAVNNASDNRPPTATTTNTTMSTSPKRDRGLTASPVEATASGLPATDLHPFLHSALAKTKPVISQDLYNALFATAADALSITSMMGSIGQPGPVSSFQSTIGGPANANVTDRQLRRKADSMCRSLTELCLALSEPATIPQVAFQRLGSTEVQPPVQLSMAEGKEDSSNAIISSPRALSRLQARRSSIAVNNSLSSPKYSPSIAGSIAEAPTPTQSSAAGMRGSLLQRLRRAPAEERDDNDQSILRAPSRAGTDLGPRTLGMRSLPRQASVLGERGLERISDRGTVIQSIERQSMEPDIERVVESRAESTISSLPRPGRRYLSDGFRGINAATGIPKSPTMPNMSTSAMSVTSPPRRYFQRETPDTEEAPGVVSRLEKVRAKRKSSLSNAFEGRTIPMPRIGSLMSRRTIAASNSPTAAHPSSESYQ